MFARGSECIVHETNEKKLFTCFRSKMAEETTNDTDAQLVHLHITPNIDRLHFRTEEQKHFQTKNATPAINGVKLKAK